MHRRPGRLAFAGAGVLLVVSVTLLDDVQPHAMMQVSDAARDQLVARFLTAAETYEETFQNLVAEETKTIEVFDASVWLRAQGNRIGPPRVSIAT